MVVPSDSAVILRIAPDRLADRSVESIGFYGSYTRAMTPISSAIRALSIRRAQARAKFAR